jgi:hypothetical protein
LDSDGVLRWMLLPLGNLTSLGSREAFVGNARPNIEAVVMDIGKNGSVPVNTMSHRHGSLLQSLGTASDMADECRLAVLSNGGLFNHVRYGTRRQAVIAFEISLVASDAVSFSDVFGSKLAWCRDYSAVLYNVEE